LTEVILAVYCVVSAAVNMLTVVYSGQYST